MNYLTMLEQNLRGSHEDLWVDMEEPIQTFKLPFQNETLFLLLCHLSENGFLIQKIFISSSEFKPNWRFILAFYILYQNVRLRYTLKSK